MVKQVKLHVKGVVQAYTGNQAHTKTHTAILKLENVQTKEDSRFYFGKRVAYIYKVKNRNSKGSKYRAIWGKITRAHGTNGAVRSKFATNLPGQALGRSVRVMLFPSRI